jgi:hypothetical protein
MSQQTELRTTNFIHFITNWLIKRTNTQGQQVPLNKNNLIKQKSESPWPVPLPVFLLSFAKKSTGATLKISGSRRGGL